MRNTILLFAAVCPPAGRPRLPEAAGKIRVWREGGISEIGFPHRSLPAAEQAVAARQAGV